MVDCNQANAQVKGLIGEVKCPTEREARNPSRNCFTADNIIEYQRAGWNWLTTDKFVNVSKVHTENLLPRAYGEYMFEYKNDKIISSMPSRTMIQLEVTLNDLEVEFRNPDFSCLLDRSSIMGCHSCFEGANLTVKIKDAVGINEDGEMASINCNVSGINAIFNVMKGKENYHQMVQTTAAIIDETCEFSCGKRHQFIQIKGYLEEKVDFDSRQQTIITSSLLPKESDKLDLGSFKFDMMGWIRSIWYFLALGILLLILFITTIKIILSSLSLRNKYIL